MGSMGVDALIILSLNLLCYAMVSSNNSLVLAQNDDNFIPPQFPDLSNCTEDLDSFSLDIVLNSPCCSVLTNRGLPIGNGAFCLCRAIEILGNNSRYRATNIKELWIGYDSEDFNCQTGD